MSLDVSLTYEVDGNEIEIYSANVTHNLTEMADAAGIYYAIWRPEEKGYNLAKEIVRPLANGLKKLKSRPSYFKKFDPPNGWGSYEYFVPFVENYLAACKKYPNSKISVDR